MKTFGVILLSLVLSSAMAQRGGGHGHHGNGNGRPVKVVRHTHNKKVVVVRRSAYHPCTVVVYHPGWGPNYAYNHRWVYFPKRNLYWDNWRNHWVYFNGTIWISQPTCPQGYNEKDFRNEKQRELPEDNDDVDDVYINNNAHQKDTAN